jgi:hypothetical protein
VPQAIMLLIFCSCASNTGTEFFETDSDELRKIIDAYFTDKILNGIKYTKAINDRNGVIEIY